MFSVLRAAKGRCCCCFSLAKLHPTLWDPIDCSMPGLPIPHYFTSVCPSSCPLNQWFYPTISSSVVPFSSCLQPFPASGSFSMSQLFASGGQSIRASALASVLPMGVQCWFTLGLIGLISWRKTCKAQRTWGRPQSRSGDEVKLIRIEEGRRKWEINNEEQLLSWRWCWAWKKKNSRKYLCILKSPENKNDVHLRPWLNGK